jgi:hypothetical protein
LRHSLTSKAEKAGGTAKPDSEVFLIASEEFVGCLLGNQRMFLSNAS